MPAARSTRHGTPRFAMSRYDCRRCDWRPATDDDSPGPLSQLSDHAFEAEHWLCVVCGLSLERVELQTCTACVALVRARLAEIENTYALLPGELGQAGSAPLDAPGRTGDETPLLGGDALALLAPGSEGIYWRGRPVTDQDMNQIAYLHQCGLCDGQTTAPSRHLLDFHARATWTQIPQLFTIVGITEAPTADFHDERAADPPSVAFELARWVENWMELRGEDVG